MGIADGLGVSPAATAGAIVSGAYFGDKLSPFSDTTNLAPVAARSNLYDHILHMLWTTTPAWLLGLLVYTIVGGGTGAGASESVTALAAAISETFRLSPLLLLPPAITLGAAILRKPVIPSMVLSIVVALLLAFLYQGFGNEVLGEPNRFETEHHRAVRILKTLVVGVSPALENDVLRAILARGGMVSMMDTMLIALCAFAFAGIVIRAGMLTVILEGLARIATTAFRLTGVAAASSVVVALITGNSYLAILVPGELLAPAYRRLNLAAKNLSRTTEDCGTVVVPIIPWSISAVFITSMLGVSTVDYAPWAVMCYAGIAMALLSGGTGIGLAPRRRDDETQPGS